MIQVGQFWQGDHWAQGIWLNKTPSPQRSGRSWLRPHYIWCNGDLISVDDTSEQLVPIGDVPGWWPGVRGYATERGSAVFRLRHYTARFVQEYPMLFVGQDDPADYLYQAISQTVQANGYVESYIRPVAIYVPGTQTTQPGLGIVVARWHLPARDAASAQEVVVTTRPQGATMTLVRQVHTAVYTPDQLLVVQDGMICTLTHVETTASLTRDTVLRLAQDAGLPVLNTSVPWEDMQAADEILVASTTADVLPVRELDGHVVGNGRTGPVTRHLQHLYQNAMRGENSYAREWLDYMVLEPTI